MLAAWPYHMRRLGSLERWYMNTFIHLGVAGLQTVQTPWRPNTENGMTWLLVYPTFSRGLKMDQKGKEKELLWEDEEIRMAWHPRERSSTVETQGTVSESPGKARTKCGPQTKTRPTQTSTTSSVKGTWLSVRTTTAEQWTRGDRRLLR